MPFPIVAWPAPEEYWKLEEKMFVRIREGNPLDTDRINRMEPEE